MRKAKDDVQLTGADSTVFDNNSRKTWNKHGFWEHHGVFNFGESFRGGEILIKLEIP